MDEKNTKIDRIIFTLGLVEVHGEANMSRLLGCLQELQALKEDIKKEETSNESISE